MVKILCFLLMFFSLAQPGILFPWTIPYRVFFLLSAFTLILYFFSRSSLALQGVRLPQTKYIYGILLTYTLSTAQFMWIPGTLDTFLFWFKKVLLFYLFVNVIGEVKDLKRMIWAVILAVVILSVMGWDIYLNSPNLLHDAGRLESVGNYNLSNSFALILALTIPIAFSLMEVESGFFKRSVIFAALGLFVVSCIFTKSRGGCLGMIIGVSLSILFSRRAIKAKAIKLIIIGLCFVAFLGYGVSVIMTRSDVSGYTGGDASAGDRVLAWKVALLMFKDRPLFGVGWGLFNENVRAYGHDKKILAHNTPISVLAETGLFGFCFFLLILYHTFKQLYLMWHRWRFLEDKEDIFILLRGVSISLLCFMVNSSFSVKDHDPIYWALLSLSGILCGMYQREIVQESETINSTKADPG